MKRIIILSISAIAAVLSGSSCSQPAELPPLNEGYATEYMRPDPETLTQEERDYLDQAMEEYNNAISQ